MPIVKVDATGGSRVTHGDTRSQEAEAPLRALLARAAALGGGRAAPVHLWDPADCGTIPMRIAADGVWHYHGSPIRRDRMVRLFASILRREPDGRFVLVTPVEKMTISVDDAPFQAIEMAREGDAAAPVLVFSTNMGDVVRAGPDHPLRFRIDATGGFVPYVNVRGGLEARLTRSLALDLAACIETVGGRDGVRSGGAFFAIPETAED